MTLFAPLKLAGSLVSRRSLPDVLKFTCSADVSSTSSFNALKQHASFSKVFVRGSSTPQLSKLNFLISNGETVETLLTFYSIPTSGETSSRARMNECVALEVRTRNARAQWCYLPVKGGAWGVDRWNRPTTTVAADFD